MQKKQQKQENQYEIPYHWFLEKSKYKGRNYFGYLNICSNLIDNQNINQKILDAGCGDGRFLFELKKRGFKNLYGIDYSEKSLSFAKIFLNNITLNHVNLKSIPFENNYFDSIFLIEVLEHIDPREINLVLKELKRVLKIEGKIIISVPSIMRPVNFKHFQHFSVSSLSNCLNEFFTIEEVVGQDFGKFSFLNLLYKFIDNRYWQFKKIAKYYNLNIWKKYLNKCKSDEGNRIIVKCKNKI
jgi:ubiquinone/menaquinone biosynthesis C-methylase UbiE